jgi:stage V sporulation protein K
MSGGDGNGKNDEFARNSADAFTNYLTVHKHDFVMIVAGYEAELESRFFALNQGLRRRFAWKFTVDKYTPEELKKIFEQMAETAGYTFPIPIPVDWFAINYRCFPHFGGSMETLLSKVKIVQGRRVIFLPAEVHNHITMEDMNVGLEKYRQHSDYAKIEETQRIVSSYYM